MFTVLLSKFHYLTRIIKKFYPPCKKSTGKLPSNMDINGYPMIEEDDLDYPLGI